MNKIKDTNILIAKNNSSETTVTQSSATDNVPKAENVEVITETSQNSSDTSTETTTELIEVPAKTINGMSIPFVGLSSVQFILTICLIYVILQQSKTASSISASSAISGSVAGNADSYWNKNKGRSREGQLSKLTVILAIIYFIVSLTLGLIK